MKKLIVILLIIGFGLYNHCLINFNNGFNYVDFSKEDKDSSLINLYIYMANVESIQYYNNPFGGDYIVIVNSPNRIDFYNANKDSIEELALVSVLFNNATPQRVNPIPVYIYGIVLFIVLIIRVRQIFTLIEQNKKDE